MVEVAIMLRWQTPSREFRLPVGPEFGYSGVFQGRMGRSNGKCRLNGNGSFRFRRAVPPGESDLRLVATNEWGQSAEVTIRVTRNLPDAAPIAFSPLEPDQLHAKLNPMAVALIIGIERYKSVSVPPAEFAENDARQLL